MTTLDLPWTVSVYQSLLSDLYLISKKKDVRRHVFFKKTEVIV